MIVNSSEAVSRYQLLPLAIVSEILVPASPSVPHLIHAGYGADAVVSTTWWLKGVRVIGVLALSSKVCN